LFVLVSNASFSRGNSDPVSSGDQTSAATAGGLPQRKRTAWPFAATLMCASLLGIGLAFCARTMLPAWAIDGSSASLLTSAICSSGGSAESPQAARTGD
jgi:hypothetical protein